MTPHQRALLSLEGLSVGDAFGEMFFGEPAAARARISGRELPPGPWRYTDDTEMALAICSHLHERDRVDPNDLARRFAFGMSPGRGYGLAAYEILMGIRVGRPWQEVSRGVFGGQGSFGNGAAMRAGPLGAFFAHHDLEIVAEQARRSAEVTHAHGDGIAGAIAVALAAALAWRAVPYPAALGQSWLAEIHARVPAGDVRDGIARARQLPTETPIAEAADALGNGSAISAPDTVPLCLWVAAHQPRYAVALWTTVEALGDRDTTCAIVGSIVALRVGRRGIPKEWRRRREPLPAVIRRPERTARRPGPGRR